MTNNTDRTLNVMRPWWHEAAYWSLLIAACAVMYVMNTWTSFKEDDMEMALLRDAGFIEFWRAQLDHYLTTNGRCSDFFATIFSAYLGKPLFNVVNTLMFGVMAHLVCLLSTGRRSVVALALFIAVVGTCFPVPGQSMLFVAGSCNYMWSIVASLLLVRLLQRYHGRHQGKWKTAMVLTFALIAGNFNEATSLSFFAGMVVYYFFNRDQLDKLTVMALIAYLAGAILIVASPATLHRAASNGTLDMGLKELLMTHTYVFAKLMSRIVTPVLAVLVGIGVLVWKGPKPLLRCVWAFILPFMILMMLALGHPYDRVYSPMATVATIILAMTLDRLLAGRKWARLAAIGIFIGMSLVAYPPKMKVLADLKQLEDKIARDLVAAPRHAILHEERFKAYSPFATPLSYVSSEFVNRECIYRAYYDKDNVQFVSDSVYDRYHTGRLLDGAMRLPLTSDRPEIGDTVLGFDKQDYMVLVVNADTLPTSPQQAIYHLADSEHGLSELEKKIRKRYGVDADFVLHGYYPLYYQGKLLLVFPLIDEFTSSITFQIDDDDALGEMTLTRQPEVQPTHKLQP